jgi:hypothetical protein
MGHDSRIYLPVLLSVLLYLKELPESGSPEEIDALFPWSGTRPDLSIHLEPLLGKKIGQ